MKKRIEQMIIDSQEYKQKSYEIRGSIVGKVIEFEEYMDNYIASFFFPDGWQNPKFKEFKLFILTSDNITFSGKREILIHILNNHFEGWKDQYKDFGRYSEDIMKTRNWVAHYRLLVPEIGKPKDGITILREKFKKTPMALTKAFVNELEIKIEYCKSVLHILIADHFEKPNKRFGIHVVEVKGESHIKS